MIDGQNLARELCEFSSGVVASWAKLRGMTQEEAQAFGAKHLEGIVFPAVEATIRDDIPGFMTNWYKSGSPENVKVHDLVLASLACRVVKKFEEFT